MKRLAFFIPLALFALFAGLAAYQLSQPKTDDVPSRMVGRPLPGFELPSGRADGPAVTQADFTDGTPKLLNIWATWCLPCIAEAPQLEALKEAGAPVIGIAIRDTPEDIAAFLSKHGDPYTRIAIDERSTVQLGIGSSGVPETFVVDGDGIIRHQHIGDIREGDVADLLERLREAGE
ncbi:DsbE family thiol:disulfide interchange protein [Erythrobacteraceae bacterium WH01K]|nr:DsbE family thiol:disulfide interchange protein [Erythrobacteraceae bacterium WH01K]